MFRKSNKISSILLKSCVIFTSIHTYTYTAGLYTYSDENIKKQKIKSSPILPVPDCETPACSSTINNLTQAMSGIHITKKNNKYNNKNNKNIKSNEKHSDTHNNTDTDNNENNDKTKLHGCPINTIELGRSAWNVIHTLAEHISEQPNEEEQHNIISFMNSFSMLYPCHICRVSYT